MYEKYPSLRIAVFYIVIYAIIWIALGLLFIISLQKLSQPWQLIVCGFIATIIIMSFNLFIHTIKAIKDPDVIAASELGMSIRHYNKYKEIQNRLKELYEKGITEGGEIKTLMKQIPNMNEWYRFSEYQYQLSCEKWKHELENISNLSNS